MKSTVKDFYPTFRVLPYYLETSLQTGEECEVYHGDSYVSSMKYHNSIFYDIALAKRKTKTSLWKKILGATLAVVGVALQFIPGVGTVIGGAAMTFAATLLVASAGVALFASGLQMDRLSDAYEKAYEEGSSRRD